MDMHGASGDDDSVVQFWKVNFFPTFSKSLPITHKFMQ